MLSGNALFIIGGTLPKMATILKWKVLYIFEIP